ncbi:MULTISPECIES: hypothetical protein [Akkermansia]|nr:MULTISPECIES: hypothetical protein [Akkermansia]MEE0532979.1 hypothetical protein [Akkermansia sp.]
MPVPVCGALFDVKAQAMKSIHACSVNKSSSGRLVEERPELDEK